MAVDNYGAQFVNIEGNLATYSAVSDDYAPYATATDMLVLQNPATSATMIRITEVRISGSITAAATMDFYLQIRTALDTGGATTAVSADRHDSNDPTPQGVSVIYTAAPVQTGTLFQLRGDKYNLVVPSNTFSTAPLVWTFGSRGGAKCPHLRPGQQIAISNNGNAVGAGTSLYMTIEWNESQPVQ